MSELDTLRPEVREAVAAIDNGNGVFVNADDCIGSEKWKTVCAELLRLASENAELHKAAARGALAHMKAEAELAALRARIAEAPVANVRTVNDSMGGITRTYVFRESQATVSHASLDGKRVRLVVDEPQDDNAKEGRSRE